MFKIPVFDISTDGKGIHRFSCGSRYEMREIICTVEHDPWRLCCPGCSPRDIICRGKVFRYFRTISIGRKPVSIALAVQRVFCKSCRVVRQVKVDFADIQRSYTKVFELYILELSRKMTILDVTGHLRVIKRFVRPRLKSFNRINP